MTLRVGIVSAAWGAFAHLPAWRAVPGVEVTAICTSRRETAEAAQARLGLPRAFWNAAEMCADPAIDIVDLGTRPAVRLPMVLAALEAGKHVYNGCPHAPDWQAAKRIDAAWRKSASIGVVDAFSEFLPAHRRFGELLDEGFIGKPLGGTCHFNLSLFNRPDQRFPYNWFADPAAGVSAMRNNGGHMLYMLSWLFGPVVELAADTTQLLSEWRFPDGEVVHPGTTDSASVILKFASGLTMQLQASWSMSVPSGWSIDVFGTEGRLATRSPSFPTARDCTLHCARVGEAMAELAIPDDLRDPPGIALNGEAAIQPSFPMALSMQAMVAAIEGKGKASPDFATALEIERQLEAIRVASAERRWVALSEIV
ncbi:MAG: Gfo/Idh/MocA family oxidoreductase [Novosphingobium sp.]|nr:Gfo/Idh/MocA family oxidoreductase [Novosphingobium sp.]